MNSVFIPIEVLAFQKPYQDDEGKVITPEPHKVKMRILPNLIAGVNNLTEAPKGTNAKSMVYFKTESGMKQEFSTETAADIDCKVSKALL